MKKAQSLSINTIVVAIIALLVLIVVVFIFGKQIGDWFETTNTCATAGGECQAPPCTAATHALVPGASCDNDNHCCRKVIFDE